MRTVCADDPRVRPLVCAIKTWARRLELTDARRGRLTSYALVLMCINYLQSACSPPVLPPLHALSASALCSGGHDVSEAAPKRSFHLESYS